MVSIITGDIVNSRAIDTQLWLQALKEALAKYGKEPHKWEIFRGDSFQLEVNPEYALEAVVVLKATIKQFKELDIRTAIGVGEKTYTADKITESNGTAFIRSGECFEQLKKQTLAINTPSNEQNLILNLMFELASLTIDDWSPTSALIIKTALENPNVNQKELATILGMRQSNISRGLKRGGYDEIMKLNEYYKKNIQTL